MRIRVLVFLALSTIVAPAEALGQAGAARAKESGSISGRVEVAGKPAAGLLVLAMGQADISDMASMSHPPLAARAMTDERGAFELKGLDAGDYTLAVPAPGYLVPDEQEEVSVGEADQVTGIVVRLERGGVLAGRIADASGRPLVEEEIVLLKLGDDGAFDTYTPEDDELLKTDDRGAYRIYGLPAGVYLVGAGDTRRDEFALDAVASRFGRVYAPSAIDEAHARRIDLKPSAVVTGVDVTLGARAMRYSAAFKVVDAENRPVSGARLLVGTITSYRTCVCDRPGGPTPETGEATVRDLDPGEYGVVVWVNGGGSVQSSRGQASFVVGAAGAGEVVVTLRLDATIAGQVVIEGAARPEVASKRARIGVEAELVDHASFSAFNFSSGHATVEADGSFSISAPPGKLYVHLADSADAQDLKLLRVERGDVRLEEPLELAPGERVDNIRVVVGVARGVIVGEISPKGVDLPSGTQYLVRAELVGQGPDYSVLPVLSDAGGRFRIEHLLPGLYQMVVWPRIPDGGPSVELVAPPTVRVDNDAPTQVRLQVGPAPRKEGREP